MTGWRRHVPALAALAIGLGVSLLATHLLLLRGRVERRLAFERHAGHVSASLQRSFDSPLAVLGSIPGLFRAQAQVSRAEFAAFVREPLQLHPTITALEWAPWVEHGSRARLEAAVRAEGYASFQLTELDGEGGMRRAAQRKAYAPLLYLEPMEEKAHGFDLLSEPVRRETALSSRDRGEVVVSARFQMVEDAPGVFSVAVYWPVYRGERPRTVAARQAEFRGMAIAIFRLTPTLERALQDEDTRGLDLALVDRSAPGALRVLYETVPGLAGTEQGRWTTEASFRFCDREYGLVFRGQPSAYGNDRAAWTALGIGLLLSVLAALTASGVSSLLTQRRRWEEARRLGQYTLTEVLGEGGMGVVYKARHSMLRRPTAIKLLKPPSNKSDGSAERALARFEREVQLTSQLAHPNTIAVYDYGRTDDGMFYYAMEFLEGITLQELVEQDGAQPPGRVAYLMAQVCDGLAEAHHHGLIHRDIKPDNLMIGDWGGVPDAVKVFDFGLVKETKPEPDSGVDVTQEKAVVGTPLYISPEAVQSPERVEERSDLYGLGGVGYFLLSGLPVFSGDSKMIVMARHATEEPQPVSERTPAEIPAGLEQVIMSCLRKDPAERPASAAALREMLEGLSDVEPWTRADARRWWDERGKDVLERVLAARRPAVDPDARTAVDVELQGRFSRRS